MTDIPRVAIARDCTARYPTDPPFDPSEAYPELARLPGGAPPLAAGANDAYRLVRQALLVLGLDAAAAGSVDWNPLRGLVPREGLVVIKPNLVLEVADDDPRGTSVVAHASVMRPLIDYVRLAGGADVEILIGDVPLQGADFDRVVAQNGLASTVAALRARGDVRLALHDLRRERAIVEGTGFIARLERLSGDPRGYGEVDVGPSSRLESLPSDSFEGFAVSDYRQAQTQSAHAAGRHVYLIPRSVLEADLFINVPKLKTHQKAGLTVAIKNLVGVNGDKARIPHFRLGGGDSGDEYPPDRRWLRALASRTSRALQGRSRLLYRGLRRAWRVTRGYLIPSDTPERVAGAATLVGGGAWYGNDTLWRALHDLNLILVRADRACRLTDRRQRAYLCVVDGIVAGEGDGPLFPQPRTEGVILAGDDALAVDLVAARYMWLDWRRVPQLASALAARPAWSAVRAPVEEGGVEVVGTEPGESCWSDTPFRPAPGWVGHVELRDDVAVHA